MYHKLTVYVKSRYQTNLFLSCCFGGKYHKYHGNSINTLQISFIFYTLCITTCFRDARHGFNIYSILCPLGVATCSVEQSCKNHVFISSEKNHVVRLFICIYGTKCCVVQHEGMCSFSLMLI